MDQGKNQIPIMSICGKVLELRKELGLNQSQMSKSVGVTVVSLSRYENGREPKGKPLLKLIELADKAGLEDIKSSLEKKHASDASSRVKRLPSIGSERRISSFLLERWVKRMIGIQDLAAEVIKEIEPYLGGSDFFKEHGRKGGLLGGSKAWENLSPEERSVRAKHAVDAREAKKAQKRARIDP